MSFWRELRRRNVAKVAVAYAVVAWLLIQIAAILFPTFQAPAWAMQAFTFALIAGFPVALLFAWAYELTPAGFKPSVTLPATESIARSTGQKLNYLVIGSLAIAMVLLRMFRSRNLLKDAALEKPAFAALRSQLFSN